MADLGGAGGPGGGGNGFGPVLKGGPAGGGIFWPVGQKFWVGGGNENLYPPLPASTGIPPILEHSNFQKDGTHGLCNLFHGQELYL